MFIAVGLMVGPKSPGLKGVHAFSRGSTSDDILGEGWGTGTAGANSGDFLTEGPITSLL
jgi:hypothetical protein